MSSEPTAGASEPLIRNITDTARWVAAYRARETERPDALFRDPYAKRLAGDRGEQIASAMPNVSGTDWPFVMRTYVFDRFISREVARGVDTVLNLAAGLDARPYRMALPSSLKWFEVDLPELIAYKTQVLAAEKPVCALERVPLNLAQTSERRALFETIAAKSTRTLVISEGLLLYLTAEEVGALARDLAAQRAFERWTLDLASPGLLEMLKRRMGAMVTEAGAPYKFAPPEGPQFFEPHGWSVVTVESLFDQARKARRLPLYLRIFAMLPQPKGPRRIWSGVCLLQRTTVSPPR